MNPSPVALRASRRTLPACGLALALSSGLGGCADIGRVLAPAPVNPESPVAAQVQSAARRNYDVPRLADVPPKPLNVPGAPVVKTEVVSIVRCRGGVTRFALTHPPLSAGTEQFASNQRGLADINPADIPPADSIQRSDAASDALRAYASPPAALASGAPPTPSQALPPAAAAPPPAHPGRHAAAARHAAPAAPPASKTDTTTAAGSAPLDATPAAATANGPVPPFPAPLPDPLLARCT